MTAAASLFAILSTPIATQRQSRFKAVGILTIAVLITTLDTSVMTVTTPTVQKVFGASLQMLEWTTTIYALFFGATMLLWSRIGEVYGHRQIFVIGVFLFGAGSLLVGLAPSIGFMIGMRALQALGAAMVNPAAITLVALMFDETGRPFAYGVNSASASAGIALGYILGGFCAQYASWRWAFFINPAFCAVALWGAFRYIDPHLKPPDDKGIDITGAALSLVGLMLVTFGLVQGQTHGWWTTREPFSLFGMALALPLSVAPLSIALGTAALGVFTWLELALKRSGQRPLLDLTLFALPSVRWGGLDTFMRSVAQFALYYGLTLYLQNDGGMSALTAGLALVPIAVSSIFAIPVGGTLAIRFGTQRSVFIGLVVQAIGVLWLWWVIGPSLHLWSVLLPNLVFGLGVGMTNAQLTNVIMQDVPITRSADAAAAAATLRQIGYGIGAVSVGVILSSTPTALALDGYSRLTQGSAGMEDNVLFNLALLLASILFALLIPNRIPRKSLQKGTEGWHEPHVCLRGEG